MNSIFQNIYSTNSANTHMPMITRRRTAGIQHHQTPRANSNSREQKATSGRRSPRSTIGTITTRNSGTRASMKILRNEKRFVIDPI